MQLNKTDYDEFPGGGLERARLHNFKHDQDPKCVSVPPSSIRLKLWKSSKINLLANVTFKWKGNNRKICTTIFLILQLLLILTLLGKERHTEKNNSTQTDENYTEAVLKSKSMLLAPMNNYSSTAVDEKQQRLDMYTQPKRQTLVKTNVCKQVVASSEDELWHKLDILEPCTICLTLYSSKCNKWNLENSSMNVEMVKEITFVGCMDIQTLSPVIEKFNFAYKLTFGNNSNQSSNRNNNQCMYGKLQESFTTEKYLLNLNEVVIEKLNCGEIFESLSKAFYMNAVKTLKINNIEILPANILGIRQLLKQFKYSLETLHFVNVTWNVSLFDRLTNQLPNLKELLMDFISPVNKNVEFLKGFLGSNHLLNLISMKGYLPYGQFTSILKFKMLSNVTLGVQIPNGITTLDLFPVNKLSNLKYMELYLNFGNISTCYLLSDYDIERHYVTKLNSNCDEEF